VTVLARQESGLLSYQSVKKETSRGKTSMALGKTPAPIQIPTDAPGKFVYVFRDGAGRSSTARRSRSSATATSRAASSGTRS
jgi:hypothetical protein